MIWHAAAARPVLLGLGSAAAWGAADFAGGLATRRARPGTVVLIAHGVSLLLLLLAGALLHAPALPRAQTAEALLSGVAGGIGLMLFYRALALGLMGLTAALAGLVTTILPVTLAVVTEGWPGAWQLAGFAVAAGAIVMIAATRSERPEHAGGRTTALAVLAGLGFGLQLVLLHASLGTTDAAATGMIRALTFSRVGGTAAALLALGLARSATTLPARGSSFLLLASLAGVLDSLGNLLYMRASLTGRLDVAAVLSSLYPAATILLAAWLLKERTTRAQAVGMGLALIAVVLISR